MTTILDKDFLFGEFENQTTSSSWHGKFLVQNTSLTAKRSRNSLKFEKGVYAPFFPFFFIHNQSWLGKYSDLSICRTGKTSRCRFYVLSREGPPLSFHLFFFYNPCRVLPAFIFTPWTRLVPKIVQQTSAIR